MMESFEDTLQETKKKKKKKFEYLNIKKITLKFILSTPNIY